MPGEKVRVIMTFPAYTGVFVFHCHNLEHEDDGMMLNFEII
jgi:FtsP/CotA-like multicopper oxidase with cupredoxin domain